MFDNLFTKTIPKLSKLEPEKAAYNTIFSNSL